METKLEEMLRLQAPPAGWMMDATSVTNRVRSEGALRRRRREHPSGIKTFDPKRPGDKRLGKPKIRQIPADRSAFLGD
jgi:hypothetical protein